MSLILSTLSAAVLLMPQEPVTSTESQGADAPGTKVSSEPQDSGMWMTDYAAAQALAAQEGKDLLIDFTGSDWCHWCIQLDKEVFSEGAFQAWAKERFVFVKLDFPRRKELPADLAAQNKELQTRFAIRGFPTVILADSAGRPYAQTGYQAGGPDAYITHIDEVSAAKAKRDDSLSRADAASGAPRAVLIAEAIDAIDPQLRVHYRVLMEEVVELGDADLKADYEQRLLRLDAAVAKAELESKIEELAQAGDWAGATAVVEDLLAEHGDNFEVEDGQQIYMVLAMLRMRAGNPEGAIEAFEAGHALDPNGPMAQGFTQNISRVREMMDREAAERDAEGDDGSDGSDGDDSDG